jgi:hypothetical protein
MPEAPTPDTLATPREAPINREPPPAALGAALTEAGTLFVRMTRRKAGGCAWRGW